MSLNFRKRDRQFKRLQADTLSWLVIIKCVNTELIGHMYYFPGFICHITEHIICTSATSRLEDRNEC